MKQYRCHLRISIKKLFGLRIRISGQSLYLALQQAMPIERAERIMDVFESVYLAHEVAEAIGLDM